MKFFLYILFLITGLLFIYNQAPAQDSLSTAGLVFTPVNADTAKQQDSSVKYLKDKLQQKTVLVKIL